MQRKIYKTFAIPEHILNKDQQNSTAEEVEIRYNYFKKAMLIFF